MIRWLILLFIGNFFLAGQELPFRPGEQLKYTARFNVLPVGEALLTVVELGQIDDIATYHINYQARTGSVADRLFKIRDNIDIWFDKQEMYTYRVDKNINEGRYHRKFSTYINYRDSIAVTGKDTVAITQPVRDPYSLFYYLRSQPLIIGNTLQLVTFDNNKQTDFQLKVIEKQRINVPAGTFSCLVVKPFRKQRALFKNQGDIEVWLSDDKRRLPVQINIKLKYGSPVLRLKEVKNTD